MSPRPSVETERRQQILDQAMTCFARQGYHLTTMDDIAAELPFSKGLLYYYFKNKRDLFMAILDRWMEGALAAWKLMLAPEEDPVSQLHQCLYYGLHLLTQSSDLARVEFEFYGQLGRDPAVSEVFKTLFAEFRAQIQDILKAGVESGDFRSLNAEALAAVLLGAYEGLAMQAMVDPDILDWSVIGQELFDMVMGGISMHD